MDEKAGPTSTYPMPDEVAAVLDEYGAIRARDRDDALELARAARPSPEERELSARLADASMRASGIDPDVVRADRERLATAARERLSARLTEPHEEATPRLDLLPMDLATVTASDSGAAAGSDPNFWYASSRMFASNPFVVTSESDGFWCRGMKNHDSGSLIGLNFGVTAQYGIAPERLPFSASGRWWSAPHMDIFGRLIGSSQDSIGFGDDWCKCWMIRRQTAFQFVFAPPGASNRRIVAERTDVQQVFFSEDAPFYRDWFGRGRHDLPALALTLPFPGQTLWVELELRFDIQLEGSAQLWIWPHQRFLIRAFQWPAISI